MTKQKPSEKAATQTPTPPAEATATADVPTEVKAEVKAEDEDEKDEDEKDEDEKDEDDKDDEKKSKKKKKKKEKEDKDDEKDEADKPKKVEIEFEATMPRNEAISYFESIIGGLRSGRLEFKQGDQTLILNPPDRLDIEVKARSKGDKGRVVFEIEWSDEHRELEISN